MFTYIKSLHGNIKLSPSAKHCQAGHSNRARPGPIPNPEVKPVIAAVLLIYVSGWEAAVLASCYDTIAINYLKGSVLSANLFSKMQIAEQRLYVHSYIVQNFIEKDKFPRMPDTTFN